MNNFLTIFKKELKELMNKQLVIGLAFTVLLFVFLGNMIGEQVEKEKEAKIALLDLDRTQASKSVKDILSPKEGADSSINIQLTDITETDNLEEAVEITKEKDLTTLLFIPEGFEKKLQKKEKTEIKIYSVVKGFSMEELISGVQVEAIIQSLNQSLRQSYLAEVLPQESIDDILNPVSVQNFLVIKDEIKEGNPAMVAGLMTSQGVFIPLVLMMVIIYCGTMVINSMGLEKESKTLETLLTLPIKRASIIAGKMAGAAAVGILMAAVYMIGFGYYMGAMASGEENVSSLSLKDIGLQMGVLEYFILGISLLLAILFALSLSMLLGIFSEDTKSAQTMIMPVIVLVMVPMMLLMFQEIENMPEAMKIILYLIPFSHPVLASRTLLFGGYSTAVFGILYLLAILGLTLFVILKIFNTDKILTAKFSFKRKK